MRRLTIPDGYRPSLNLVETERAIKHCKDLFESCRGLEIGQRDQLARETEKADLVLNLTGLGMASPRDR